jgi:hypothetical protein
MRIEVGGLNTTWAFGALADKEKKKFSQVVSVPLYDLFIYFVPIQHMVTVVGDGILFFFSLFKGIRYKINAQYFHLYDKR